MGHSNCDRCGNDTKMCDCCPKETTEYLNDRAGANKVQVGGDHYKAEYQHWDWIVDTGIGYLEGNASKYIVRWRSKNGIQDLEKSSHYVTKAKEAFIEGRHRNRSGNIDRVEGIRVEYDERFFTASKLGPLEADICRRLRVWQTAEDLDFVLNLIAGIMSIAKEAKFQPPRPTTTR